MQVHLKKKNLYHFKKLIIFDCSGPSIAACRLPLVVASRGCSLVVVCGLLIVVAFLVAEHRLKARSQASGVVARRP